MNRSHETLLMVRLAAEIATKSNRTRKGFQRQLVQNIGDALDSAGVDHEIEDRWSRILVGVADRSGLGRISNVFGISSISEIDARVDAGLEEIVRTGAALYRDRVRGRTYAVRARRAGEHPFTSRDIKVELGAALNEEAEVDLDDPQVTVSVEVRENEAFLFSDRIEGAGGLPLGVEGKAVCLISGGFDSAVAAWLTLKRGISLDYVFCNLAGDAYERSVLTVAKVLSDEWSYGDRPRIHVVDFREAVEELQEHVTPRYWQVVLKRLMYRVGEAVAEEIGGDAVVTGESVGQVSSQTLGNLRAIDEVASLPVFRPLLGLDKEEIIQRADRIGTSALSARIHEYCAILPDRPVTRARPEAARKEEAAVDPGILERALEERRVLDLRALEPEDLVRPYLFVEEVPEDALVFDLRPPARHARWHYPGAECSSPREVMNRMNHLGKEPTYVLYCEHGPQAAHLAEVMQRAGFQAYAFRQGAGSLMRAVEEDGAPEEDSAPAPPLPHGFPSDSRER